jgi:hypothetical protein
MEVKYPGKMPIVEEILAVMGGIPKASSVGNDNIVPPPATPLNRPAPNPAARQQTMKLRPTPEWTVATGMGRC